MEEDLERFIFSCDPDDRSLYLGYLYLEYLCVDRVGEEEREC